MCVPIVIVNHDRWRTVQRMEEGSLVNNVRHTLQQFGEGENVHAISPALRYLTPTPPSRPAIRAFCAAFRGCPSGNGMQSHQGTGSL